MRTREEAIAFCRGFSDVLEDYPFHDDNWTAMRHCGNKKIFALIFERDGKIWINVKCDTDGDVERMLRESYELTKPVRRQK